MKKHSIFFYSGIIWYNIAVVQSYMSILYGSRVTIFQGHLFIVHFRLAQLTFTVNNHRRKSTITIVDFRIFNWLLLDDKLRTWILVKSKWSNRHSSSSILFKISALAYRRSRTQEDSQSSVADTLCPTGGGCRDVCQVHTDPGESGFFFTSRKKRCQACLARKRHVVSTAIGPLTSRSHPSIGRIVLLSVGASIDWSIYPRMIRATRRGRGLKFSWNVGMQFHEQTG